MESSPRKFKRPESVLVVVATRTGRVLLMQRRDDPGFWQSVTGSLRWDERSPAVAAVRELVEETGLPPEGLIDLHWVQRFPILPAWRARFAPEVRENVEHAFALWLPAERPVLLNPQEHLAFGWFGFDEALPKASSWSNRAVIERLATV
ncbi:MAG: dihydroneopterin triphosphate diphosphatase [Candidatus Muproteobacteria bacterium RBG_16_62_13]|uniref:Dihydroneopterin triphosphate diphosphatase n=1 Tax=Candidatus Muproteobacteria bacterium RBG_16_62_13 TaxID=1817756 RepID=A0A1F6T4J8_9PROT|nr:MAG: dihydroneopterin triphosphate diphosphatase [Candidatus Muproteobacteria bacterium RBG_16_62_13]